MARLLVGLLALHGDLPERLGLRQRVRVSGNYSGELTIAAENDIIVDGNITAAAEPAACSGLIANNFVRVKHPFCRDKPGSRRLPSGGPGQTARRLQRGSNGTGSLTNPTIDAAILAIEHSFIVDHYDCGASLGTLTVNGAISQKFRGPVGTTGGRTGYIKNYNYDDRLRYMEPPNFLDPVEPAWHIQRETLDFPLSGAGVLPGRRRRRRFGWRPDRHPVQMAATATLGFLGGADRRQLRQRRRPPGAARRVDRRAALALPALRRPDRRLRQRPGPLLAAAARPLPLLRRARSRPATR